MDDSTKLTTAPRTLPDFRFSFFSSFYLALGFCLLALPTHGDTLIGTNGDHITGKVVQETVDFVIFDSDLGGRLTILRARISEIQRASSQDVDSIISATTHAPTGTPPIDQPSTLRPEPSTTLSWRPPAIGYDNADWIQLKSGEWIRGRFYYLQRRKVEFDSDELSDLSLNFKDIRQIYPANPVFTRFSDRRQIFSHVVVSNDVVEVIGPEQIRLPRDQLESITPGGNGEIAYWSGNLTAALSLQAGNSRQATLSTSAELARRTPSSNLQLNYLANYSVAEGIQSANNHRVNALYDVRLNRHWFVRPAYLEYYKDELANIAHKGTVGVGIGYYILDREDIEWILAGGPGYQVTRFRTVEPGQPDVVSTPAAVLQSSFKADLTRRLKFIEAVNIALTSKESGLYSHHAVSTLNFEIKRHLDLNTSFVWDYLHDPHVEANGLPAQKSDFRLNVGVGVKF